MSHQRIKRQLSSPILEIGFDHRRKRISKYLDDEKVVGLERLIILESLLTLSHSYRGEDQDTDRERIIANLRSKELDLKGYRIDITGSTSLHMRLSRIILRMMGVLEEEVIDLSLLWFGSDDKITEHRGLHLISRLRVSFGLHIDHVFHTEDEIKMFVSCRMHKTHRDHRLNDRISCHPSTVSLLGGIHDSAIGSIWGFLPLEIQGKICDMISDDFSLHMPGLDIGYMTDGFYKDLSIRKSLVEDRRVFSRMFMGVRGGAQSIYNTCIMVLRNEVVLLLITEGTLINEEELIKLHLVDESGRARINNNMEELTHEDIVYEFTHNRFVEF